MLTCHVVPTWPKNSKLGIDVLHSQSGYFAQKAKNTGDVTNNPWVLMTPSARIRPVEMHWLSKTYPVH